MYFLGGVVCAKCRAHRDGPVPPPSDEWATLVNACEVEVCAKCQREDALLAIAAEIVGAVGR